MISTRIYGTRLKTVDFVVYDTTGRILRTGRCNPEDLQAQAGPGEFVLEDTADDLTQKVVDGKVLFKTREEFMAEEHRWGRSPFLAKTL
jgi:hypothetical protein